MSGYVRVDVDGARDFLTQHYGNRAAGVTELGHGDWATAYAFMLDGAACVARFAAQCDDFKKDRFAASYHAPELPIPRIIEVGDAPGGFFAISERAYGDHLNALDVGGIRAALPSLFAAHDAARLADISRTAGYGGWDASGNAPFATWQEALLVLPGDAPTSRIHGWRERLVAYPKALAVFDEGYQVLRSLVDICPTERHLIHGDPINHNILVEGDRITAVLDWGCGIYGDFLYDLAQWTFAACWFPAWRSIDFVGEAERHYKTIGLDVPSMRERLRCYEIQIGLDSLAYNAWCQRPSALLDFIAARTLESVRG